MKRELTHPRKKTENVRVRRCRAGRSGVALREVLLEVALALFGNLVRSRFSSIAR
jgi:hypothetical protein